MIYVMNYTHYKLLKAALLPGEDLIEYINKVYLNNDTNVITQILIK